MSGQPDESAEESAKAWLRGAMADALAEASQSVLDAPERDALGAVRSAVRLLVWRLELDERALQRLVPVMAEHPDWTAQHLTNAAVWALVNVAALAPLRQLLDRQVTQRTRA